MEISIKGKYIKNYQPYIKSKLTCPLHSRRPDCPSYIINMVQRYLRKHLITPKISVDEFPSLKYDHIVSSWNAICLIDSIINESDGRKLISKMRLNKVQTFILLESVADNISIREYTNKLLESRVGIFFIIYKMLL